jgi:hypothetical protein
MYSRRYLAPSSSIRLTICGIRIQVVLYVYFPLPLKSSFESVELIGSARAMYLAPVESIALSREKLDRIVYIYAYASQFFFCCYMQEWVWISQNWSKSLERYSRKKIFSTVISPPRTQFRYLKSSQDWEYAQRFDVTLPYRFRLVNVVLVRSDRAMHFAPFAPMLLPKCVQNRKK